MIDLVQGVVGEIEWVTATGDPRNEKPMKDDINLPFTITLANGATISFSPLNFEHYREVSLDLWGTTGRLAFFNETLTILNYPIAKNRSLADLALQVIHAEVNYFNKKSISSTISL